MHLDLEIPDDVARILSDEFADLPRAVVEALAIEGYRSNRFSDGQLRQILGFSSRMQVHAFLKKRGVHLNYSMADLEQDRKNSLGIEPAHRDN
jgi:predicted HTH domain antitoxin